LANWQKVIPNKGGKHTKGCFSIILEHLPECTGSNVTADEDVGEVRAVTELDEGLKLRSHEQGDGHDDGEEDEDDGKQSGNGRRQLLLVRLNKHW